MNWDGEDNSLISDLHDESEQLMSVNSSSGMKNRKEVKTYVTKLEGKEMLDTEEQEELISDLREQAQFLDKIWKYFMVGFGLMLFMLHASFVFYHFGVDSRGIYLFRELITNTGFALFFILQLMTFATLIVGVLYAWSLPDVMEELELAALITGIVTSTIYIFILYTCKLFELSMLWVPFSNCILIGATFYAARTSSNFQNEVNSLAKVKYNFRSV